MSNNQELFSDFSYTLHVCGDLLQLSQRQNILKMRSLTWNFFRQNVYVTASHEISTC